MIILGIESSCDETAAAVVKDGNQILSSIVASQDDIHSRFGGIVPELASRNHIGQIIPVIETALSEARCSLDDIQGIAVTKGPGLIGSLLVGLAAAKAISFAKSIPLIGIHHIEGHLTAALLQAKDDVFPLVGLVASGGHTNLYFMPVPGTYKLLGQTRDDAAGEAFDKVAKLLGLPFPGGPSIDRTAESGNPNAIKFPRPNPSDYDFSFSGLKTAVAVWVQKHGIPKGKTLSDLAASFQEAVVDSLIRKLKQAAKDQEIKNLVVCGGVARNQRFRKRIAEECDSHGYKLLLAPPELCTDNAAMIAAAGHAFLSKGIRDNLSLNAQATMPIHSP